MADFSDIGALLGVPAGNELSYQKGLALGANTQNAMQQARERVRQNTAIEKLQADPNIAAELGLTPGLITAAAGGIDPRQFTGAANQVQERNFRAIAGSSDPNVDAGARNRALTGVASSPVETFKAVGSKGYQDIYHPEKGVVPLGAEFNVGAGGGDAAAIQILRAFGFMDENGHVRPGSEQKAFDVMRSTGKTVDEGGVPGVIDFNPFNGAAHPSGGAPPMAPAAAPAGPGAELAPPAPVAPAGPMQGAPAVPAAAPGSVAGPGVVQPASSATRVGHNVAEIERNKVIGKAVGENQMAAPAAMADIDKLDTALTGLVNMPGFDSVYGNVQGQPGVKTAMGLFSQDTADAQAALQNIDAQSFGISIQKMRGLGQLSNAEGLKVTDAFSVLSNTKIGSPMARQAVGTIKQQLELARERVRTGKLLPAEQGAAPAAGGGVSPYADPGKEARYQAWKAAQGRQ